MLAAYAGKLQAVKELRYHKARYDMRDKGGSTPMHWAMDGGNTELIEWMLDDGAEINAQDYNGWTPLLRVGKDHCESNVEDYNGWTPLLQVGKDHCECE